MNSRDPSIMQPGSVDASMPDVQGSIDHRSQPIQRVGVRGLRYPMMWQSGGAAVPSVAIWNLFVALPAEQKGTHMSRFVALLESRARDMSLDALVPLHHEMLGLLQADTGRKAVDAVAERLPNALGPRPGRQYQDQDRHARTDRDHHRARRQVQPAQGRYLARDTTRRPLRGPAAPPPFRPRAAFGSRRNRAPTAANYRGHEASSTIHRTRS
jgi:hypothetical protein